MQLDPELQAVMRRPDLPDQQGAERLIRYETHNNRELYRAMDQLERLQRQRMGEHVPPPMKARLAID